MRVTRPGLPGIGLLFAGSFLVALLIVSRGGNQQTVAAPRAQASQSAGTLAAPASDLQGRITPEPPSPPVAEDSDDIPDIATARVDATMALEPQDRILALQVLADDTSRESFDTLLTAVTAAPDPRERATAISALRQRSLDDGDDVKIRNAMQAATYDTDPLVVVMAESMLEDFDSGR